MKVNRGAFCPLTGSVSSVPLPAPVRAAASLAKAAEAVAVTAPPAPQAPPAPPAAPRHARRLGRLTLVNLAACAAVLGCAAVDPVPWRIEPTYRVQGSGPGAAAAYLALARQFEGEDRVEKAIEAYRKAALAAPDAADVHNALGLSLARNGQYGPAVLALRRAVALGPDQPRLLNNLGYALMLDGRMEEARAIIRLTLALEPTHSQASRNLAYAEERMAAAQPGQVQAATQAATQVAAPSVKATSAVVAPADALPAVTSAATAAAPATTVAAAIGAPAVSTALTRADPARQAAVPLAPRAPDTLPPASLDGVSVEIVNGNGIVGMAARLRGWLRERGVAVGRLANQMPYDQPQTQVLYKAGKESQARAMALRLPVVAHVLPAPSGSSRSDLRVLIGHDVIDSAGCSALSVCATPERLTTAAARPS